MQIIEVSVIGVRSAVITLERPDTPLRFVLFPMIHVGTRAFYDSVTARLADCQLAVAEGIRGRSVITLALTSTYRVIRYRRRLVVQHIDYKGLRVPVIGPDMTAAQLRQGWRQIPIRERLTVWSLIPAVAFAMLLFGSRRLLADFLAVRLAPGNGPADDDGTALGGLIRGKRDTMLVRALTSIHRERGSEPLDVAVVYGAGHMPAVIQALHTQLGYRPSTADWLTVWEF